ncbi:MAG: hypothetical protein V5A72_01290 [Candidatus Nanohaloarchaea archaeon]
MVKLRDFIFRITPLGRADEDLRDYLEESNFETQRLEEYETVLNKYRTHRAIHNFIKLFLYAGVATSIATTFGIEQAQFIAQIASYIGVSILFVLYSSSLYFS